MPRLRKMKGGSIPRSTKTLAEHKKKSNSSEDPIAKCSKAVEAAEGPKTMHCQLMVSEKLLALEKGNLTDCKVLVGENHEDAVELHAFKSDMVVASSVFRSMFADLPYLNDDQKWLLRVKSAKPDIFKHLLRFVHVHEMPTLDLEETIKLAILAERYEVKPLVQRCFISIKSLVNSSNVWDVLNRVVSFPNLASVCDELLSADTQKCFNDSACFSKISEESFVHFLQLNEMSVDETALLKICLDLNASRAKEDPKCAGKWIRIGLQHLRVLLLSPECLETSVNQFLTDEEKQILALKVLGWHKGPLSPSLCSNVEPRVVKPPQKLKRGRPKKVCKSDSLCSNVEPRMVKPPLQKLKRGRPKKVCKVPEPFPDKNLDTNTIYLSDDDSE